MEDADEFCDDTDEVVTKPTASDVGSALEALQNLFLFSAETGIEMAGLFHDFNHYIRVIKLQQRNNLVFRTTLRENKLSIIHKLIVFFLPVITHLNHI